MTPDELRTRLTNFGADVIKFCNKLRDRPGARTVADQLSASGTSVSANYRGACRARSRREFISKISVALEEADESAGWFEIIERAHLASPDDVAPLFREAHEIIAILSASRRTAELGEASARRQGRRRGPKR
ncbi:MAG: four helix bundle protein [Vicinamibacterales bacterium]